MSTPLSDRFLVDKLFEVQSPRGAPPAEARRLFPRFPGIPELEDAGVEAVSRSCPALDTLNLQHFERVSARSFAALSRCTSLRSLTCVTDDATATAIAAGCTGLTRLSTEDNTMTDAGIRALAVGLGARLRFLDAICNRRIGDAGVVALAEHCSELQELWLTQTGVTDVGVTAIAKRCAAMERLVLVGCRAVTDAAAAVLAQEAVALRWSLLYDTRISRAGETMVALRHTKANAWRRERWERGKGRRRLAVLCRTAHWRIWRTELAAREERAGKKGSD